MKLTKPATFGNTQLAFNISFRKAGLLVIIFMFGLILWRSPLFAGNIFAIIGYIAVAVIIVGETPTHRGMLTNAYGVLFRKPLKMAMTQETTMDTFGHGISEVEHIEGIEVPLFKTGGGFVFLVYTVTSGINWWSNEHEYEWLHQKMNILFNIFEEGETWTLVTKTDNDTGMAQLIDMLEECEQWEGDDFARMSEHRKGFLHSVVNGSNAKSQQQHVILMVKRKNIQRTVNAMKDACRIVRPATNPGDILLAAMGFEGGQYCE